MSTTQGPGGSALYGGIEGGGTKFVCAVGSSAAHLIDTASIRTSDPGTTLAECVRFFQTATKRHGVLAAIGFGCFGPLELRPGSPRFGRMMSTPKPGWSDADLLEPLQSAFQVPLALDTDVGAAALAELRLGAGRNLASVAYVTVGTGIGGAVAPDMPAQGRIMHAEMGHIPVRRDPRDLSFAGVCPFHGDCLEGLASGPAIRARWGCNLDELPATHDGRSIIAGYLGQCAAVIALTVSVERIVFGGGVMTDGTLLPLVRAAAAKCLNGYLQPLKDAQRLADYICAPALGDRAGICGALLLAEKAIKGA